MTPSITTSQSSLTVDSGHSVYTISALSVLMLVGVSFNFVAFFTYLRKRHRKATHIFTMCLAAVDCFNSSIICLAVLRLAEVSSAFEDIACTVQPYLSHGGAVVSAGLVMVVAFERHNKVASPFRAGARELYWIVVLLLVVAGLLLAFIIVVYRVVGYDKAWIPMDLHNASLDYTIHDILRDPEIFTPVLFYGVLLLLFLIGYVLMFVQYTRLARLIISKRKFGSTLATNKTGHKGTRRTALPCDVDAVGGSTDISSTYSCCPGDGHHHSDMPDFKVKDSAVFTIFPSDYYRKLSQTIIRPPNMVRPQDNFIRKKLPNERNGEKVRRRTSSLSMVTRSRSRSPLRTIFMLSLALIAYVFYIPTLCVSLINFIKPSLTEGLTKDFHYVMDALEYSYSLAFILNPVLYTFCNYGFRLDISRAFRCHSVCCRSSRVRSSSLGTPRHSGTFQGRYKYDKTRTQNQRHQDTTTRYPFMSELEDRLLHTVQISST